MTVVAVVLENASPDQLAKIQPAAGVAVSCTASP